MAMANTNLHKAKVAKNDEFYTQLRDVAEELKHYKPHFQGKVVFCNCDDPTWSAFWRYFHLNFAELGLKKLISTHYDRTEPTYKMEYEGGDDNNVEVGVKTPLEGNGDFRNAECIALMDEADIVVTNPPFSMFREFVQMMVNHNKKFVIIGSVNAITYKEFFPLLKENLVWGGYAFNKSLFFSMPESYNTKIIERDEYGRKQGKVPGICWYTNLDIQKRHEKLILWQRYYDDNGNPLPDAEERFPHYDNYDAINVDKVSDIPMDYKPCWLKCNKASTCPYAQQKGIGDAAALCEQTCSGAMGVPITFLDKHNPDQFDVIRFRKGIDEKDLTYSVPADDNLRAEQSRAEQSRAEQSRAGGLLRTSESSFVRKCNGVIGVPITFFDRFCPSQFFIVGATESEGKGFSMGLWLQASNVAQPVVSGQRKYKRLFIRAKV